MEKASIRSVDANLKRKIYEMAVGEIKAFVPLPGQTEYARDKTNSVHTSLTSPDKS